MTTGIEIIYGQFRNRFIDCGNCGQGWWDSKEKMTDVNISAHLITDAYKDDFDTAMLISGDSDLVPPIKIIKEYFPQKKIIVVFPPERQGYELKQYSTGSFVLGYKKLKSAQFPYH